MHAIVPGHVMEPEEEVFGTGLYVVESTSDVRSILTDSIGATAGTVETYALLISLVIVDGTPLQGIFSLETVRLRAVVMVELENVMQPQRHHVVDTSFAALHHHLGGCCHKAGVTTEGQLQPFVGDFL